MGQRTFLMLGINCVPRGQLMGRWEGVVSTGKREKVWGENLRISTSKIFQNDPFTLDVSMAPEKWPGKFPKIAPCPRLSSTKPNLCDCKQATNLFVHWFHLLYLTRQFVKYLANNWCLIHDCSFAGNIFNDDCVLQFPLTHHVSDFNLWANHFMYSMIVSTSYRFKKCSKRVIYQVNNLIVGFYLSFSHKFIVERYTFSDYFLKFYWKLKSSLTTNDPSIKP